MPLYNTYQRLLSYHNPIFVNIGGSYSNLPKPLRFEVFGLEIFSSFSVIAEAWNTRVWGSDAFVLKQKLQITKKALKDWNINHFGKIQTNIKAILTSLDEAQKETPSPQAYARKKSSPTGPSRRTYPRRILWKLKSR